MSASGFGSDVRQHRTAGLQLCPIKRGIRALRVIDFTWRYFRRQAGIAGHVLNTILRWRRL